MGVAIATAFAMLLQGFLGMGAMAMPMGGQTIEICTAHGTKTIAVDQSGAPAPSKQAPCPHCDQCLSPALAVATIAPLLAQPVFYAVRAEAGLPRSTRLPPARAPPRPPSQGPPTLLNI
jgi:hypothetical protein